MHTPVSQKKHKYDIDIVDIYYKVKDYYSAIQSITHSEHLKQIRYSIWHYCKISGKDYAHLSKRSPIIIDSNDRYYQSFLSLSLSLIDIPLIPLYLDHHRTNFKGNLYSEKDNFVGFMEFLVLESVKKQSLIDTSKRLDCIVQWIKHNKVNERKLVVNKSLEWKAGDSYLSKLSKYFKVEDYTELPTSFEKVFTENQSINWLKEPEFLAYLLHKLYTLRKIKVYPNGKGYLKTSEKYFCNYSQKKQTRFKGNYLLHNVIGRQREKYAQLREDVDSLIDTIFK